MNSIIDKIKDLRSITGLSIADCKKALVNNNMDIEKAAKDLKILGLNKASLKSQRSTAAGQVSLLINKEKKIAVISEVNCETDFVAKSKDFLIFNNEANKYFINEKNIMENTLILFSDSKTLPEIIEQKRIDIVAKLGENIVLNRLYKLTTEKQFLTGYNHTINDLCKISAIISTNNNILEYENLYIDIAMQVAAMNPKYLSKKNIPNEIIENESEVNIKKFIKENVLLEQDFIKDRSLSVKNAIANKFEIINFIRFEVGEKIT